MLTKWPGKQNRQRQLEQSPPARFWTATSLGRKLLDAEQAAIAEYLPGHYHKIVQLAPLELPALDIDQDALDMIMLRAAVSSWRTPLLASLETLPLCSRSVDVVIWRYLGLEWRVRRRLLADVVRVLAPGGLLLTATLNPMAPRVWRFAGLANIGLQSAGGINTIARALGLHALDKSWHGPGRWRLRPLRISVLQKKTLGGVGRSVLRGTRRRVARPAIAVSRTSICTQTSK